MHEYYWAFFNAIYSVNCDANHMFIRLLIHMRFSIFSFKLNEQEEKIIKDDVALNNITISEFFRSFVLEKFEADMDLAL